MKPIVCAPNAILTRHAQTVTTFDKRLEALIGEMRTSLLATKNPKGVGLAAPQIGLPLRIFITRPKEESAIRVFLNPEIIKRSDDMTDGVPERENKLEGCLSIPKIWGKVKRAKTLTLQYRDEKGTVHKEEFSGFIATIIQHETDHTNGILFTQRVLEQKEKLYETGKDEEGKEVLEEITI
ncbi:MAG: peptide deformylase [Microgenomates group bacterium GW2011_GWA2_46_16]|nr:MAG: peptide deformylase [Microgenomates group bacterium GW2011_GWA2_46_16]